MLTSFLIYRSIAVYGCFAAGLLSLIIFAAVSWFSGKIDANACAEEPMNQIALSRGIRITVYLITALLAIASSVISLIDVDQTTGYNIVPVRMSKNEIILFNTRYFTIYPTAFYILKNSSNFSHKDLFPCLLFFYKFLKKIHACRYVGNARRIMFPHYIYLFAW